MAKVDGASFRLGDEVYRYLVVSSSRPELPDLTKAEREVVALVCEGYANGEVAKRRGTSVHTVCNQLAAVFDKVGVKSRVELVELVTRRSA